MDHLFTWSKFLVCFQNQTFFADWKTASILHDSSLSSFLRAHNLEQHTQLAWPFAIQSRQNRAHSKSDRRPIKFTFSRTPLSPKITQKPPEKKTQKIFFYSWMKTALEDSALQSVNSSTSKWSYIESLQIFFLLCFLSRKKSAEVQWGVICKKISTENCYKDKKEKKFLAKKREIKPDKRHDLCRWRLPLWWWVKVTIKIPRGQGGLCLAHRKTL